MIKREMESISETRPIIGESKRDERTKGLEARQAVEWARKPTFSLKGEDREGIRKILHRSVAVVGEDPITGEKVFDVQFPQLVVGSQKEANFAQKMAEKIYKNYLWAAYRTKNLPEDRVWRYEEGGKPTLKFQESHGILGRPPESKDKTKTVSEPSSQIERVANKRKQGILVVAGTAMALASCNVVPSMAPSATEIQNTPFDVVSSKTATPIKIETVTDMPTDVILTATPEIDYSKVDVFDEATWPEKYKKFAEGGWIGGTETERQEFQNFLNKIRAAFLAKENIDISRYEKINENERYLWGMIEWYYTHQDQVKENNLRIAVTPSEYEYAQSNPDIVNTSREDNDIRYEVDDPQTAGSNYRTEVIGRPIAGKDNLVLPRGGLESASGTFLGLGVVGAGENQGKVGIMDVIDMTGKHNLFIFAIPDEDMVLEKGYVCYDLHTGRAFILKQDLAVGESWKKYGETDDWLLTGAMGKNIQILFGYAVDIQDHFDCPHPVLGGEMAFSASGVKSTLTVPYLPWGEQVEPLVTETPVATSTKKQ